MRLRAYLRDGADLEIHPASSRRDWMDATPGRHAYRCLPLGIANAHGWELRLAQTVESRWNGGPYTTDVALTFHGDPPADGNPPALSAFGSGIVTFHVPALFRTDPGYDLYVTGPVNRFKDGVQALTAVIETDWLTEAGFAMSWKHTRAGQTVRFERGEPYAFLFPVPRGLVEAVEPSLERLADDPALHAEYYGGERKRLEFQASIGVHRDGDARYVDADVADRWQRTYLRGVDARGQTVPDHRSKLTLRPFRRG